MKLHNHQQNHIHIQSEIKSWKLHNLNNSFKHTLTTLTTYTTQLPPTTFYNLNRQVPCTQGIPLLHKVILPKKAYLLYITTEEYSKFVQYVQTVRLPL